MEGERSYGLLLKSGLRTVVGPVPVNNYDRLITDNAGIMLVLCGLLLSVRRPESEVYLLRERVNKTQRFKSRRARKNWVDCRNECIAAAASHGARLSCRLCCRGVARFELSPDVRSLFNFVGVFSFEKLEIDRFPISSHHIHPLDFMFDPLQSIL